MDIFDRSSELEQRQREEALARLKGKLPQGVSLSHCIDCGGEIVKARQLALPGVTRCRDCQEFNERKSR